jgi:5,10-methylenetetrahydromethanopterin reductase
MGRVKEFGFCSENLGAKEYITTAKLAEELGYGTYWLPEDYFYRGPFVVASAIASNTRKLKTGVGVVNPYTRHPALTAMEFAALDELSEGRAVLGVGGGLRYWVEDQLHIPYHKPQQAMRETIDLIKRMLRGEQLNYMGEIFQTSDVHFHFQPPRKEVPISLGATGPKNLQLAGEIADGVILGYVSGHAYVRHALEQIQVGAKRAGKTLENYEVVLYALISVEEDDTAAREAIKPFLATCISVMTAYAEQPLFTLVGLDPERVREMGRLYMSEGKPPVHLVTDEMIDAVAIAGDAERCRENLNKFVDAGVTQVVAFDMPTISGPQAVRNVHEHLMPFFL